MRVWIILTKIWFLKPKMSKLFQKTGKKANAETTGQRPGARDYGIGGILKFVITYGKGQENCQKKECRSDYYSVIEHSREVDREIV